MTGGFQLVSRLEADSVFLTDWPLCQVRLMDDVRFPWLILVPRRTGLEEWTDLEAEDSAQLAQEIGKAGHALVRMFTPTKLNVGALGNIVRQMHVHVIARFESDPAWPGPVWGQGVPIPYEKAQRCHLSADLLPLLE
jgi:diadenosine tetraphosphate (Ap4A) HIT family hydrolase